jgi:hypothetical protein
MGKEPKHERGRPVPREIIPDQQQTQAEQLGGQGDRFGQSLLPAFPLLSMRGRIADRRRLGQGGEDLFEFRFLAACHWRGSWVMLPRTLLPSRIYGKPQRN